MTTSAGVKKLLNALAQLGGTQFHQDDIKIQGREIIVPEQLGVKGTIKHLQQYLEVQETITDFSRTFNYRPWDGAHAVSEALLRLTGTAGLPRGSFFSRPQLISIPVGIEDTVQVPWGQIEVPLIEGMLAMDSEQHKEYGPLFRLHVSCPRKYRSQVEGLFRLVEEELMNNSIYRGRAIDGQEMPEFVDLRGVDPERVVYSTEVWDQLNANVFALLRHTQAMRDNKVSLKRTVLAHGPYGTGKTLLSALVGQEAVKHGWTFILCRPGRDDLALTLQTARLYQPSVVFFEDIDTVASSGESSHVTQLLDMFDGIRAKGTEILALMTTNHADRIHKGMLRPGRLDAVVEIGGLDAEGFQRLIQVHVPAEQIDEGIDWPAVGKAFDGFLPAFAVEAISRAQRYSMARNDGAIGQLSTEDFVLAADGLRPQLAMMEEAGEGTKPDSLSVAMTKAVKAAAVDAVKGIQIVTTGARVGEGTVWAHGQPVEEAGVVQS